MKKKSISLKMLFLLAMAGMLASCEKSVVNDIQPADNETYTISLAMGGEYISVSDAPLSRTASPGKFYAVNVFCKKIGTTDYVPYAYGLFDDPEKMMVIVKSGNLYKFECTIVKEDKDQLYHDGTGYLAPFLHGSSVTELGNEFVYDATESLSGLAAGTTNMTATQTTNYPRMYRYYGVVEDFDPASASIVTVDMRRAVFGLHFLVTPPTDGSISVDCWATSFNVASTDTSYDQEAVYTFNQVSQAIVDGYNGNIRLTLTWTRADGSTVTDTKTINVKRNVMTTITIDTQSSTKNAPFSFNEEDDDMTEENTNWTVTD